MKKISIITLAFLFMHVVKAYDFNNRLATSFITQNCLALHATPLPKAKHKLVVIAHRGSHLNVPENTLAAYENAVKAGADYVEIDLRTTKDGHLIIMHDASINRMTGTKGLIKDLNYSDIKNLELQPAVKEDTATYHIPEFADVLNVCKGRINIYLDFKEADVEKTYSLLKAYGMQNNVVVYLNEEEQYGQWKNVASRIPLMSSLPENASISELNNFLDKKHLDVVDNAYTVDLINLVHKRKIAVWLDVQSEDEGPVSWEQALKLGADGLQTDHPEKLIQYLKDEGKR
ncbi:MAG TPA: glycerophosphodiester phosphodiesterase family protein [Parafilimonas sp.]|nr:glycerophosphodiester phosphodiesterase family protein [Parafilimonas sp.]